MKNTEKTGKNELAIIILWAIIIFVIISLIGVIIYVANISERNNNHSSDITVNEIKNQQDYTKEEFDKLSDKEKEEFFESFDSAEELEGWLEKLNNQGTVSSIIIPWETEGNKLPEDYTKEEFDELSDRQQEAFFEWFDSTEEFEEWQDKNKNQETVSQELIPWEIEGNKLPEDYTKEEFDELSDRQQEVFFEWFNSVEGFEEWLEKASN